jgi:hypothetical protein
MHENTHINDWVFLSVIKWKVSLSILIFKSSNSTGMIADDKNTHFMPLEF